MDAWQIVYVPDKPPIPPDQQSTVDVIATVIEPRLANTLVRRLNQIVPLENLRHVKRVRKKSVEGKTLLCLILCLASEHGDQFDSIPHEVQELISPHKLSTFVTKVCKYAATSKEEWEEQCKLWPTSFHPPTYSIDGITGFSEEDSRSVFSFMNSAIQLAKSGGGSVVNAAVIVDPSAKIVIATARDQIYSWHAPKDEAILETSCSERPFASHIDSNGVMSCETPGGFPDDSKQLYDDVSCLYPWRWAEQKTDMSSCCWHPLRHAAIVAIESSASRDRRLYPSSGDIQDKLVDMNSAHSSSTGSPAKRQKTNLTDVKSDWKLETCCEGSHSLAARPYLCTGYDIFLVWEPCAMCAMALVHQRIRRIFFAFPNPNAGAVGSVYRLQGEKSLNHHYAVFRVLVPAQVLDGAETCHGQPTSTVVDNYGI
ncbi:tRNA-specific adenosine deaminase TAD3 isoform X2 [Ziziphus jujuba]|uniref:tRNA-specific adenosine deaminase TAD3 isoform X2 n=1 Tax=Ziziphus jujuba TaxID=326968 RepID=A0ABM3IV35_ZIZJJ|nr:tRNA-specific adenosine deaminase TAD3 isoform X2 [Ziziphus jujuba]